MTRLAKECMLGPLGKVIFSTCEPFLMGKAKRKLFENAILMTWYWAMGFTMDFEK